MAFRLRTLTALAENLGSFISKHTDGSSQSLETIDLGKLTHFLTSADIKQEHYIHTYIQKNPLLRIK